MKNRNMVLMIISAVAMLFLTAGLSSCSGCGNTDPTESVETMDSLTTESEGTEIEQKHEDNKDGSFVAGIVKKEKAADGTVRVTIESEDRKDSLSFITDEKTAALLNIKEGQTVRAEEKDGGYVLTVTDEDGTQNSYTVSVPTEIQGGDFVIGSVVTEEIEDEKIRVTVTSEDGEESLSFITEEDITKAMEEGKTISVDEDENGTVIVHIKNEDGTESTFAVELSENQKEESLETEKETEQETTSEETESESVEEAASRTSENPSKESQKETTAVSKTDVSNSTAAVKDETTSAPETSAPSTSEPATKAPTSAAPSSEKPTTSQSTTASHEHTWVADKQKVHHEAETKTVHHDAETKTVHHDAETKKVHHDAEIKTVHHDAETKTVHHEEEGHYDTTQVLVSEAYDEPIYEVHLLCNDCGYDFTAHGEATNENLLAHDKAHALAGEPGGWGHVAVVVDTIHHDAVYETQQTWVVDKAAYDETVVVKEAYDETVVVKEAYDETVVVKEAYDETVVVKKAYDETVVVKPAYDEEVITGYHCSGCGEKRNP